MTVYRLASDDPALQASVGNVSTATWDLDSNVYVSLISLFDDQTTERIVQTLSLA
ncbi:MAG: hypothetical protein GKC10_03800 [Methanosarcinales archaeon]|nr:hypothetical protein [Methanosarcinales archaeon]